MIYFYVVGSLLDIVNLFRILNRILDISEIHLWMKQQGPLLGKICNRKHKLQVST